MNRKKLLIPLLTLISLTVSAQTKWYDPMDTPDEPYICGRAWNQEIGKTYNRFPERLKPQLSHNVWGHGTESAGLKIRFTTNADTIYVKYTTTGYAGGLYNLTPLSCSGADLYATDVDGNTHWIGNHMQWSFNKDRVSFTYPDINSNSFQHRGLLYTLYLPSYNGVKQLRIGVNAKDDFHFLHESKERPIVVYGTSIVQGASPSRPGLMFTNMVERSLGTPVVNLGFSGSALMEPGIFKALSEIDAKAFIIDPMPNSFELPKDTIVKRAVEGIRILRSKSQAPILMVESCPRPDSVFLRKLYNQYVESDAQFRKAYEQLVAEGVKGLYYLSHSGIHMNESSMIEGTHPNDIGVVAYANAYIDMLRKMLPELDDTGMMSCTQRRDGVYEWSERHNEVIELNRTANPEILMIGNSITHFWGGTPKSQCNGGKEWDKLFGKRRVVNMGFGWDRTENVMWRLKHGEIDDCHPKQIFLMIGINDLNNGSKPEVVAKHISLISKYLRQHQPQAALYVIKVLPAKGKEALIAHMNNDLLPAAMQEAGCGDVPLIDLSALLTHKDGTIVPQYFLQDGLHPNAKGYHQMGKGLKKYLK